jgi:hypothetical protein
LRKSPLFGRHAGESALANPNKRQAFDHPHREQVEEADENEDEEGRGILKKTGGNLLSRSL